MDLLEHFAVRAARQRIPAGQESCACCDGTGTHDDRKRSACSRCDGNGYLRKDSRDPWCPGREDLEPRRRRRGRRTASTGPYYHGTRSQLRPGDLIRPGEQRANYSGHGGTRLDHAYFTSSEQEARAYARNSRGEGIQRIYHVEPTGPHEPDEPRGHPDYRSADPLRVVRETWHDPSWDGDPRPWYEQEGAGHRTASMPQPDYDPSEPLPTGRGLWYRAHIKGQPLDEQHARSRPLNPDSGRDVTVGLRGYSAWQHPHDLAAYMHRWGWSAPEDADETSFNDRHVVAFHGRQVGRGRDREALVVPEASPHCCGKIIHSETPWHEFDAEMRRRAQPRMGPYDDFESQIASGKRPDGSFLPWHPYVSSPEQKSVERHERRHASSLFRLSMAGVGDYGMSHRPLRDGAPVHDLGEAYQEDIYTHPHYWAGAWPDRASAEGLAQLRRVRGKPDAPVDIYRASPPDAPRRMHTGDWVTLSHTYAQQHAYAEGEADEKAGRPWEVRHAQVPAHHVRDAGTDQYREQGYWGPDIDTTVHRGRRQAAREEAWEPPGELPSRTAAVPAYRPQPEFHMAPEHWPEEEKSAYHERQFGERRQWKADIRRGLSMGHLSYDQAKDLGYHGAGHDSHDPHARQPTGWQKLPHQLYHVTTNLAAVRASGGLRSQKELGITSGHGLGSSEDDTISLTTDPHIAHGILAGLHEYHSFLNHGHPQELLDKARTGHGGSRPFLHELLSYHGSEEGKPFRHDLDGVLRGKQIKHSFGTQEDIDRREGPGWSPRQGSEPYMGRTDGKPMHSHWERDSTPEEDLHDRSQLYKAFTTFREHAGGPYNPGFMSNNERHFARLDPRHFALLHVRPRPGAQGYPMPGEAEWRTTTGDALETHKAERLQDGRMHEASLQREADYDYRGRHQGPGEGEDDALHEIGSEGSLMFPEDVHEKPHVYGGRHPETIRAIRRAKGNPGAMVTMYRGLPQPHREINPGDWVGLSHGYARGHAESESRPGRDWHVISHDVPAKYLRTEGNSLEEWTYQGPPVTGEVRSRISKSAAGAPDIRFEPDYHGRHRVSAWPPGYSGDTEYSTPAGSMMWHPEHGTITQLQIGEGQHGQGLATALWNRAHEESARHGLVAPVHSESRTPAADAWAHSVGGEIPPLCADCLDPKWQASLPPESQLRPRQAAGGQFSAITAWGKDRPHAAAIHEAQEKTRLDEPMMTMQLPEPNEWSGRADEASETLRHMLRRHGYPEEKAQGAWVARKPASATASSTGYDPDERTVGIGLTPRRWDYGTMAHEAAHLLLNHKLGLHPAAMAQSVGMGDPEVHGHEFARTYEDVIRKSWGDEAGDAFRQHHRSATRLVSNYRRRVHGLPGIEEEGTGHTAAAGHLANPHTGGSEWFHGTQVHKEDFGHSFSDPTDMAAARFEVPEGEGDDTGHWNRYLGNHFTADHDIARQFASGEHSGSDNEGYGDWDEREEHQGVVHARLSIKNPKHYASEHDMDHEAYEHEHAAGNHPINHLGGYEDDEERDEMWQHAMRIHREYGASKIPASTYGHYMSPFEKHPMRTAWLNTHPDKFEIAGRFKQRLMDQGYDGITYGNEYEKGKKGRAANTSAIAFHPHQSEITQHHNVDEACDHHRTAAAFVPHERIFGPTYGLDHRLFDDRGELRPEVAAAVLERMDQAIRVNVQITGSSWQNYVTLYLAGSQASEWTSPRLEGNSDFDVLADIDYGEWRGHEARGDEPPTDEEITLSFNRAMRKSFNDESWHPEFDPQGTWHLTGYCNGKPITSIRPYAAWDITNCRWAVRPPHLPAWSADQFPQGPALIQQARALASEVRAILRLPEPFRTQEARRIWDYIHAGREEAFSDEGLGWQGAGNVLEKYLDQVPGHLVDRLKSLKYATAADLPKSWYHGTTRKFNPGDKLLPGSQTGTTNYGRLSDHVWVSDKHHVAGDFARQTSDEHGGEPRTYEVQPHHYVRPYDSDEWETPGATIIRELPQHEWDRWMHTAAGTWDRSGDEPRWDQPHDELLHDALWSWKGSPADMQAHMEDERRGAPQPGSGSGKQMRAQAAALLRQLASSGANPVPLYRGDHQAPRGVQAFSSSPGVAQGWARRGGGSVHRLPAGAGRALRVADHIDSEADHHEHEWIVDLGHHEPGMAAAGHDLMAHFGAWHPGPHYHGTDAELEPGDLIEPGKYPKSHQPYGDEQELEPREHTYFSPRRNYVIEHYGPNVYEVEPAGDYTRDPEYGSRTMFRSRHPLRVVRQVSREWGLPHEGALQASAGPVYYRGYGRDSQAITGIPDWDSAGMFVSHDPSVAALYGPHVEKITMSPDTRVKRHEGAGRWPERLSQARDEGYHVAEFHKPHDFVGHVIMDQGKIVSREPFSGHGKIAAVAGSPMRNPYHGTEEFGGRPEWSHTWFHGTRAEHHPDLSQGRPPEERESLPPDERMKGMGWPQPNKLLGTHFSPLHSVGHGFARGMGGYRRPGEENYRPGIPSALVHVQLNFSNPAHFPTEQHLNRAVASWASKNHPHWHDDKLNSSLAWNYSDQEGTHHDWDALAQGRQVHREGLRAQQVLQWHPHLPEILKGFTSDLHARGHHGITYGNEVEGPGNYSKMTQDVRHISAIATDPSQIRTTHVEHFAPPGATTAEHPYKLHGDKDEDGEPEEMEHRITGWHEAHAGEVPRPAVRKTASGGQHWYHGTRAEIPEGGYLRSHLENRRLHFTSDPETARLWGSDSGGDGPVKVYEVQPEGAIEPGRGQGGHASRDPVRVIRRHSAARQYPVSETGPLYHGTTEDRARRILEHGFQDEDARIPGTVHLTPHADLAASYAEGRVKADGKGTPAVLKVDNVRGVPAHETGYSKPESARNAGADYMDKGPEVVVLNNSAIHGITRHASSEDMIDLYHHTTPDAERSIYRHGFDPELAGDHDTAFFSDHPHSQWEETRGHGLVHIRVPHHLARPEGNGDYAVPFRDLRPEHLIQDDAAGQFPRYASGGSGDRYVTCSQGHEHWGAHGAAGLLIRYKDGQGYRYLLQKRAPHVDHGGTWSVPGGALGHGEDPVAGAMREAREELGSLPRDLKHHHTVTDDHGGGWAYHTVVMDSPATFMPGGNGETQHETAGHGWFRPHEVKDLDLHPGFAKTWDTVRQSRTDKTAARERKYYSGTASVNDLVAGHETDPDRVNDWARRQGAWPPVKVRWGGGRTLAIQNGHHRYDAARQLGMKEMPVHVESGFGLPSQLKDAREITSEDYRAGLTDMDDFGTGSHNGHTAVIQPGSLPDRQQSAFDVEDMREHRRQMLDVAQNPDPGTRVWRGELRPHDEHPASATSAGMHWSVNPDSIVTRTGWDRPGLRPVVWQGVVENHAEQAFPRSHPMWRGRHESFGHEAEVRFRPGARVRLEGAYVHDPQGTHPHNYLVPGKPEVTSPNWKWHPLDHHVTIAHRPGQIGSSDYSDVGISHEGAADGEMVDMYHHTTPESADAIRREKYFDTAGDEYGRAYFTSLPEGGSASDYGTAHVHLRMPRHLVNQWPGPENEPEHYYDVDAENIKPHHFVNEEEDHGQLRLFGSRAGCACCSGAGEHPTGHECYRCDASGYLEGSEQEQPFCDEIYRDPAVHDRGGCHCGSPARTAAAGSHLRSPQQYYHGTATPLRPGQILTPGGHESHHSTSGHVYMTNERARADRYAWDALKYPRSYDQRRGTTDDGERPQTYVVEATGDIEADPHDTSGSAWRTSSPVRVIKEVKHGVGVPGELEDWAGPVTAAREKPAKRKEQVNYRPAGPHADKRCGTCTMYRLNAPDFESGACTLVKGIIDENDVCDEWYPEKKDKTAARDPWQTGLCGTYAVGLMRMRPGLRMGVAGDEKDEDGYIAPDHYFAHDDTHAYDSTGKHELPYSGRWKHSQLDDADPWVLDAEHENNEDAENAISRAQAHAVKHRVLEGGMGKTAAAGLETADYEGREGDPNHITRTERGMIPVAAIAHLHGAEGERPGEHRNRQGPEWESFKRGIAQDGIRSPLFITVDHGAEPRISEGSHRRDAAVELGMSHVPAEIRYYGHAERQGTLLERHQLQAQAAVRTVKGPGSEQGKGSFSGMMVALVPPRNVLDHLIEAMGRLDHKTEDRKQMHLTVLYLGKEDDFTAAELGKLPELVRQWGKTVAPFKAILQGSGTFHNDGNHPVLGLVDLPGEARHLHHSLAEFLKGHGIAFPEDHSWVPHITLAYSPSRVRFLPKLDKLSWTVKDAWYCRANRWESFPLARKPLRGTAALEDRGVPPAQVP